MLMLALLAALQSPSPVPAPPSLLSPFARAKAGALLSNHLPCLGCHELGGDGGRIGPSLSRLRGARTADFVLRMLREPQRQVRGTVMPRSRADSATQDLIARYLVERDPTTPAGPVVARPPDPTGDTTPAARYAAGAPVPRRRRAG
jgi:cytochrome c2